MFSSIRFLLFSLVLTALVVSGGVLLAAEPPVEVKLVVNGEAESLLVPHGSEVGEVLEGESVSMDEAVVSPSPATSLESDTSVTVKYAKTLQVALNGERREVYTLASTVGEFLEELHPSAGEASTYSSLKPSTPIAPEGLPEVLVVSTAKLLTLEVDGEDQVVISSAPTVEALLEENEIGEGRDDIVSRSDSRRTSLALNLKVTHVRHEIKHRKVSEDLATVVKKSPKLLQGEEKVRVKASPRITRYTYRLTYHADEVVKRKLVKRKTIQAGRAKVLVRGTRVPLPPVEPGSAKAYAQSAMQSYGWTSGAEFTCLENLWEKESNWRWNAANPSSSAYGIPQALPGSKMATAGADWLTNPETQIDWGLGYIAGRYGTPCNSWSHSVSVGWY